MVSFTCDYTEGAHPRILERLVQTNFDQQQGYGEDVYCESARRRIREAVECPGADVFFLVGGTQTNATVIDALLQRHEGVVAVESGHIAVHESGAVEAAGHKVLTLPVHEGKMRPAELKAYLERFHADPTKDHMVWPGMVYISCPTEAGTLYSKKELTEIQAICREYEIPLFVDGARLGYGLMSPAADFTLPELARLCDVFYIGGTKVGALCGEAVVFPRGNAPRHFFTLVKQHGALLAKGRLLGIQFDTLMQDGLFFKIARHAVEQAMRLRAAFISKGFKMYSDSPTNQQFVLLDKETIDRLEKDFVFEQWFPVGDLMNCRFVTSWATRPSDVDALIAAI